MQAHDVKVEKFSQFEVRGNEMEVLIAVAIAALKWSRAEADAFADVLHEGHPDLLVYDYYYERIPEDAEMLRPTIVERIGFAWRREIHGPERRADVNKEFAARRHAVLSMLADYAGKLNVE